MANDDLEDVGLAVNGAPLAKEPAWLPAIEQFGEGIFFELDPAALKGWLQRPALSSRVDQLEAGVTAWVRTQPARGGPANAANLRDRLHPMYIMAHGLAHALMTEVAIDCGYPASALKERIYVVPADPGQIARCGLLIYTASAGNQGTLGGLVEVTRRFGQVLSSALDRLRLCSGDPICADHHPASSTDDRALLGAACHGCLLIAETSCEARNLFLDRALLLDTVGNSGCGFFS